MLDTAFAPIKDFPLLAKKVNLKNAYFDFGLPKQCDDSEIYQRAIADNRFVLTINFDDFNRLIKKNKPGIIGIPSQLTNAEIDRKVSAFLTDKNPDDFLGEAMKI